MKASRLFVVAMLGVAVAAAAAHAEGPDAKERGRQALLGRHFNPPTFSLKAYGNLWRQWGDDLKEPPTDYHKAVTEHYGLHPAPYPNGGYPMGLREAPGLLGKALATDCLLCHGGSINGQSYVGLGNATVDYQALYEDLAAAEGRTAKLPFRFANVRGTTEAGAMAVYLLSLREPDLTLRRAPLDLDLHDDLCEDAPAWWLLKKKKTMYHTGSGDARSVRSLMQFMLTPLNPRSAFDKEEAAFADIRAYLLSLEPPKYPFAINRELAKAGEKVFVENCSRCHGTYGEKWTYPNRIVPLEEVGTDPTRYHGISERFGRHYNKSWFAHEREGWYADDYPGRMTG